MKNTSLHLAHDLFRVHVPSLFLVFLHEHSHRRSECLQHRRHSPAALFANLWTGKHTLMIKAYNFFHVPLKGIIKLLDLKLLRSWAEQETQSK